MNFFVESNPQYIMRVNVKQENNVVFAFLEKHHIHLNHF